MLNDIRKFTQYGSSITAAVYVMLSVGQFSRSFHELNAAHDLLPRKSPFSRLYRPKKRRRRRKKTEQKKEKVKVDKASACASSVCQILHVPWTKNWKCDRNDSQSVHLWPIWRNTSPNFNVRTTTSDHLRHNSILSSNGFLDKTTTKIMFI